MQSVGFIGLGVLGSAIAGNIVKSGIALAGYDVTEAARVAAAEDGVEIVSSIRDLAERCGVIFTCLPNAPALMAVAGPEGLGAVRREGQIVVELSTLAVADKEAGRALLEAEGRHVLDCPVSGNRIMALKKGLTAFCSGEREDYEAVRELLLTFCKKEHFVGPFGNGSKTKFCGNILNLVHNTVAAEAMVLAIKSGLDPKMFHEVISGSGSSSAMFEVRGGLMADNDYGREGMNFSVPLKDSRIIAEHAASMGVPIMLYQTAVQFYHAAAAQGLGHLDAAAVCKVMERMANCEREPS
ncbi:NAD(P)-dependent oxidoreductase [Pelagibacterium montanilacus]|uniref:NAD(P)-dependent oxidoreductase n=1 Tax=Pelagibacterium montanilacus TaxID=2185280 RepID=UPI000F8CCD80|nr:NAD(P)-dependent oxidoreductase [Pelagibacterium montanilacus]